MYEGDPNSPAGSTPVDSQPAPDDAAEEPAPVLTSAIPTPKRYAHHGKRRRSYTEEMFRCQHVDKISRSDLVCNSLLWKNRPATLRAHLLEHISVDKVNKMSEDEVNSWYVNARRIFLAGIPEDLDDDDENAETEEDSEDAPQE